MQLLSNKHRSSAHSCSFGEAFPGPADSPEQCHRGEGPHPVGRRGGIDLGNQGEKQVSHTALRWLSGRHSCAC